MCWGGRNCILRTFSRKKAFTRCVVVRNSIGWCNHAPKFFEHCVYAPAATRKRHVAPACAADSTFSKSMKVCIGVSKLARVDLTFTDAGKKISCTYHHEVLLTQIIYCRPCMRSVVSWHAPALLTERSRQVTFWNTRHLRSFHQTLTTQEHRFEPSRLQYMGINAIYQVHNVDKLKQRSGVVSSTCVILSIYFIFT